MKGSMVFFLKSSGIFNMQCREGEGNDVNFRAQGKVMFPVSVQQRTSSNWSRWEASVKGGVPAEGDRVGDHVSVGQKDSFGGKGVQ